MLTREAKLVFTNGVFSPNDSNLEGWVLDSTDGRVQLRATADSDLTLVHSGTSPTRISVEIPQGKSCRVLESWSRTDDRSGRDLEINLEKGAALEWICWQTALSEDESSVSSDLASASNLNWFLLQSNCKRLRQPITARLNGANAEARFFGLAFGRGDSRIDQQIEIQHLKPETKSRQTFKSVLRDRAKNIFVGKVVIAQGAQKSDAIQKHQSLNFHSTAESITRPELEISADDVKAAHGATVGRLDESQLFYLQTRGISKREATELLARAFIEDLLSRIQCREFYRFIDSELRREIPEFVSALEAAI